MPETIKLTRADARRAMVRHHFTPCAGQLAVFDRLRSVQFDPLAPVGCNHDLVLQARVPGYKVGDWQKLAYEDRHVYDGWDKMASLVPFEGWPLRRHIYTVHRRWFEKKIFEDHKEAVDLILKEIADRGPLMPKECEFQQRKEEWKKSWFGPSVTKQVLRALWHSGLIMTAGRKGGQHVYDLTERVVPSRLLNQPVLDARDAVRELVLERHRAMGIVRPSAPSEVWSQEVLSYGKRDAIAELVQRGDIVPVEVEGVKAHAPPDFLLTLDQPLQEPRVVFVAPLDPFLWDRKMIAHLFGFEYVWEVYVPEPKRRWGYYVLPVLFGDALVARAEFWCREGVLTLRRWHFEPGDLSARFFSELERSLAELMHYSSATRIAVETEIDPRVHDLAQSLSPTSEAACA
jgi:uncharacterized protein YcaQ